MNTTPIIQRPSRRLFNVASHSPLRARGLVRLCSPLLALCCAACESPEPPHLDVRGAPTLYERPLSDCESLAGDQGAVTEEGVFYVVHALPEGLTNIGGLSELSVEVETACATVEYSARHDDEGLVSLAVAAPPGASCGVIVRAEIAGSSASCRLPAMESPCTIECPVATPKEPGAGSEETDTTG